MVRQDVGQEFNSIFWRHRLLVHFFWNAAAAFLAQLVEHALRKRMVTGSIPVGGYFAARIHRRPACNRRKVQQKNFNRDL